VTFRSNVRLGVLGLVVAACGGDDASDSSSVGSVSIGSAGSSSSASASAGSSGDASASSSEDGTADTTTGAPVGECSEAAPECGGGQSCRVSACCEGVGFCVADTAAGCGGFIGKPCPDALVCVLDACVADGDGRCVDAETAAALQAAYPDCWT